MWFFAGAVMLAVSFGDGLWILVVVVWIFLVVVWILVVVV
jgi:hypothetical protein